MDAKRAVIPIREIVLSRCSTSHSGPRKEPLIEMVRLGDPRIGHGVGVLQSIRKGPDQLYIGFGVAMCDCGVENTPDV